MAKGSRPCEHCGVTILRVAPTAPIPAYCSKPDCYPRCSITGCEMERKCKGMCLSHYGRMRRHGDPLIQVNQRQVGPCRVGVCTARSVSKGYCAQHYRRLVRHGDPIGGNLIWPPEYAECAVASCKRTACNHRGWCTAHYARWFKYGDPSGGPQRMMGEPPSPCSIGGCDRSAIVRGLCGRHHQNDRRTGNPTPPNYEWAAPSACKVCGDPPGGRFRQFCSYTCWGAWRNYEGEVPLSRECVSCGVTIQFLTVSLSGRKSFRARSYCDPCRRRYKSWGLSVTALAARDGAFCGLCGCDVDMESTRPDVMCPSVDHIIPRSLGGTNDPSNLQLAHLLCNIRKGNRVMTPP